MSRKKHDRGLSTDVALKSNAVEPKPPRRFGVYLINDDYTPMSFVIEVLQQFFCLDYSSANQIMLQVHHQGKAICGVYPSDIAETKVIQVNSYARMHQHPLLCRMEEN